MNEVPNLADVSRETSTTVDVSRETSNRLVDAAMTYSADVSRETSAPVYATIADLTTPNPAAAAAKEEDYELPSGLVVRIRPLTRMEAMIVGKRQLAGDAKEAAFMAYAMVNPRMSEGDVKKWQTYSDAGEMQGLSERITEISGMSEKGAKAAAKSFPESGE